MYLVGIAILGLILYFIWYEYKPGVWNEMIVKYPSIAQIEIAMPEYYDSWKKAFDHAESTYQTLIQSPLYHSKYPYQQLKDVWSLVLERWDAIACAPAALNLQEEISAGARILQQYAARRLESMREYDTTPYRTVWFGTG